MSTVMGFSRAFRFGCPSVSISIFCRTTGKSRAKL